MHHGRCARTCGIGEFRWMRAPGDEDAASCPALGDRSQTLWGTADDRGDVRKHDGRDRSPHRLRRTVECVVVSIVDPARKTHQTHLVHAFPGHMHARARPAHTNRPARRRSKSRETALSVGGRNVETRLDVAPRQDKVAGRLWARRRLFANGEEPGSAGNRRVSTGEVIAPAARLRFTGIADP